MVTSTTCPCDECMKSAAIVQWDRAVARIGPLDKVTFFLMFGSVVAGGPPLWDFALPRRTR